MSETPGDPYVPGAAAPTERTRLRMLPGLGAVAAVAVALWGGGAFTSHATARSWEDAREFAGVDRLVIDNRAPGDVRVSLSEGGGGLTLDRAVRESMLNPADIDVADEGDGGTVWADSRCARSWPGLGTCSVDYRAAGPSTTAVDLSTRSGGIVVTGLSTEAAAESSGGDITIEATPRVASISARAGAGDVTVTVPEGSGPFRVTGRSESGERTIAVRTTTKASAPTFDVSTSSGDVAVHYR
ncbi:DUF4097 family beta strand repeat-containing protein [Streptomonospora litoralis]|uniref:DUF4097 domain-containing protein n=1 Tax=Streptomonospora litoralis TaxID=2498135 RepID=A0A4P6Q3W8_9ACTN|nr:DUF4097 family beta strand repeat-containing protein [Streptomonospora litoralis]QBI53599.1 hypothetical protein EKD16_09025 [Streptomonospora litoralis]